MPTNHDETLHERYAREHQAHLAIYARMTPEQISDMATELHNALARLAALSQQAEPVCPFCGEPSDHCNQSFPHPSKPAPAKDETEPVYQFQWREIGEGDWMACSHSWFRFCEASPEHDTRVVEVARPAQTEQQPAYVECRECTDCGHVGINDAHQTDATCAMCDWSGPSPVEDQCPDCGKENVMGAACPKCSGRYRILAETHVAAPIAQTAPQGTTSDKYRAELYDEVWEKARSMGYGNVTNALIELERMKTATKPEQSRLVEALEAIVRQYPNPDISHVDYRVHACKQAEHALEAYRAALSAQGGQ